MEAKRQFSVWKQILKPSKIKLFDIWTNITVITNYFEIFYVVNTKEPKLLRQSWRSLDLLLEK